MTLEAHLEYIDIFFIYLDSFRMQRQGGTAATGKREGLQTTPLGLSAPRGRARPREAKGVARESEY